MGVSSEGNQRVQTKGGFIGGCSCVLIRRSVISLNTKNIYKEERRSQLHLHTLRMIGERKEKCAVTKCWNELVHRESLM